jgi:acyltransferase
MPKAERSAGIDAVRVIGIVAVVVGHVWTTSDPLRDSIYTWHVPLFLVLAGYLWTEPRQLDVELKARWRSIGLPYVAWLLLISALYFPWIFIRHGSLSGAELAAPFLGGTYIGRPYSAFWFMGALFGVALLYRLMQSWPMWVRSILSISALSVGYVIPDFLAAVPLGMGVALPSLIFIVAGHAFKLHRARFAQPVVTGALLLLCCAVAIVVGVSKPLDLKHSDFGTPMVSVLVAIGISIGLVLCAEGIVPRLGLVFAAATIALARAGTMVILTHAVILWILGTPAQGSWWAAATTLTVTWGMALIVAKTPLAPILVGSRAWRSSGDTPKTVASPKLRH